MANRLLIRNGSYWTAGLAAPQPGTILVHDGRIEQLGMVAADVPADRVIDAAECLVIPGFIDAHLHLLQGGESLTRLDLADVDSREAFEAKIAAQHAALAPGEWLIAHGWSSENWPGGALPEKSWLRAAGDRPVVCYRMDLHATVVNDAVLAMCELAMLARDPEGGWIGRDAETGEPNGLMVEAAAWRIINPLIPRADAAGKRAHLLAAQQHAHALGITTVGSMEYARDVRDVYEPLAADLTLRCRITLLDRDWPMSFDDARRYRAQSADDHFGVIGCKAFIDGTLGSRTARLKSDYADDPGNRGLLVELAADGHLRDWARAVADERLSPSMHAIGDEAARLALEAVEAVDRSVRPRIEHAQQVDPADMPRFGGLVASMQPLHKADDGRYARARLGDERMAGFFPFRSLKTHGAVLAFGSDWPVVSLDPIEGMRAAITGLTRDGELVRPEENLTVAETFAAYTRDAAWALGMDDAGRIEPGAPADLAILDADPFTIDWASDRPRVVCTIARGRVVHEVPHRS